MKFHIPKVVSQVPVFYPLLVLIIIILIADRYPSVVIFRNHYVKHPDAVGYEYIILDEGKESQSKKTISYLARTRKYLDKSGNYHKCTGDIKIYLPKDSQQLQYGDVIRCNDAMTQIRNFSDDFNYVRMMKHKRIYHSLFVKDYRIVAHGQGNPIISLSKQTNDYLKQRLKQCNLKPKNKALAIAMLLGDKKDIDLETRNNFANAGLAHILCVSGLHIGVLLMFLTLILKQLPYTSLRKIYFYNYLCIAAVWIMDFIVGFTPSATRVAMMITIIYLCKIYYPYYNRINILCVLAFLSLLANPYLLFNISFQLSYLSVFGIMLLSRAIRPKRFKFIINNLSVTTSAQIFTFPVVFYHFKTIPVFFLLSNLIVVPLLQVVLISIILLLFLQNIPLLGQAVLWLCDAELTFIQLIASLTGQVI